MTKDDLVYMAGIIDGEGCITSSGVNSRGNGRVWMSIVNTDMRLMSWIQSTFGGSICERKHQPGRKIAYQWTLTGVKQQELLGQIIPYLKLKRGQASLAVAMPIVPPGTALDANSKQLRLALCTMIRELNQGRVTYTKEWE